MRSAWNLLAGLFARSARSADLRAALALALLVTAFLWEPISRYDEVHFTSADLTQEMLLTRVVEGHVPGNRLQSDSITQMQPWLLFNRDEFAAGRLPLWNPWNGAGVPHLANYQSAVFSPYSLPFYLLGFKAALLWSAALKLWTLGLFTWFFLRRLGLLPTAALLGAAAFTFAGHNVLLLSFPHVGAMITLPAGLLCAEIALQRFERARARGTTRGLRLPLAGLTVALLAGLLAGNPEPFHFSALGIALWCAWRLTGLLRSAPAGGRGAVAALAGKLLLSAAIAAMMAAFQLLPFFEYLQQSRVLEQRSLRQTPLEWRFWPLMLFPDALGNPSSAYNISESVPPPNYELVNMAYCGGLLTLLALAGALGGWRDTRARFFALASGLWLLYAYDLFGAYDLLAWIPTLDMAPMNRSQGLWNFLVACGAALLLDRCLRAPSGRAWKPAGAVLLLAATGTLACLIGVTRLMEEFVLTPSPNHKHFLGFVPAHVGSMCTGLALGLLALGLARLGRAPALRTAGGLLVVLVAYAQTGHLWRSYNPVSENRFVFPVTPVIAELQRTVGTDRLAIVGQESLPPCSNIAYGLQTIANYDGMWVRDYDRLYRANFGEGDNWRPMLGGTLKSLRLFGVKWLLAPWGWLPLDTGLQHFPRSRDSKPQLQEILPGREVTQTFVCQANDLRSVMVVLSTWPRSHDCTLHFRLEELDGGRVVTEQKLDTRAIQAGVYARRRVTWPGTPALNPAGRPVVFPFDPQPDSRGRTYRLTLSSPDGRGGEGIAAWSMSLLAYGEGQAARGGRPLAGELLFDFSYGRPEDYETVAEIGDFTLYRFCEGQREFAVVGGAVLAKDDAEALELLRSQSFHSERLAVLSVGPEEAESSIALFGPTDNSRRRIVMFDDSVYCYLVGDDGRTLAHIDDEATFLANKFDWERLERLPRSARENFVLIDDADRDAKRRAGLRLINRRLDTDVRTQVLEDTPTRVRLHLRRTEPGYLLIRRTHYPGWVARLNGRERPVLRANLAFSAVEVPAGHWEIELSFEPASLRLGLWIGALGLLVALFALLRPTPRS